MKDRLVSALRYVENYLLIALLFVALGLCLNRVPEFDPTARSVVAGVFYLAACWFFAVAAWGLRLAMVPPPQALDPTVRAAQKAAYDAWIATPDGQVYVEWLKWSDAFYGAVEGAQSLAVKGFLAMAIKDGELLVTRPDDLMLERRVTCMLFNNRLRICRWVGTSEPILSCEPLDRKHAAQVIAQSFEWLLALPDEDLTGAGGGH